MLPAASFASPVYLQGGVLLRSRIDEQQIYTPILVNSLIDFLGTSAIFRLKLRAYLTRHLETAYKS
jgi:hypothetical protein